MTRENLLRRSMNLSDAADRMYRQSVAADEIGLASTARFLHNEACETEDQASELAMQAYILKG